MKTAKTIYLSVLPVFLALVLVFSFVHAFNGGSKSTASNGFIKNAQSYAKTLYEAQNDNLNEVANTQNDTQYVSSALTTILGTSSAGIGIPTGTIRSYQTIRDENDERLYDIPQVGYNSNKISTNRFTQEYTVTAQKQIDFQNANGGVEDLQIAIGRKIKNTVVVVPGQDSKDGLDAQAILITVHMDSPKMTSSGVDASTMGVAVAQIAELFNYENNTNNPDMKAKYKNDIVFLFTDARYDSSFGVMAFFDEFYGFYQGTSASQPDVKDIVSRIEFAINLDSIGTSGASLLLQTSNKNSAVVKEYAKAMGGTVSSSFISDVYCGYASDFNAFGDLNALNLVTFGSSAKYSSVQDNYDNVSETTFKQKADLLIRSVEHFGSFDLSKLNSNTDSVYYSFLGLFTVSYPVYVSYILGAITLLLMGAIVAINLKKNKFSFKALLKASIIQILALVATIASMFVVYLLMGVVLAGLGLFTIQSITTYVYANAGTIIGYSLFATVILSLFYALIRKHISKNKPISAQNLVRGAIAILSVLSAVLCFACPNLAYMFAIPAILFLACMLTTMLVTKYDINRLFIYIIPFAISLAFTIPVVVILALTIRAIFMPIILLPLFAFVMTVAPYILMLNKPLNALVKKLPHRTIRVQRTVVEKIHDKAKPEKYTEREVKKIFNEKVEWRYRHGAGVSIVTTIAVVVIMICSACSVPFGANVFVDASKNQPFNQYTNSVYNNSLLLTWTGTDSVNENPDVQLQIHDKGAFKYFNYALNGYSWDSDVNAYVKDLEASSMTSPAISTNADTLSITPAQFQGLKGVAEIHFTDISSVSKIKVLDKGVLKNTISVSNTNTLTLRFPLDSAIYNTIDIEFEFKTARASSLDIVFNQYIWDLTSGDNLKNSASALRESAISEDVRAVADYFKDNDAKADLRFGITYTLSRSISF